MVDALAPFGSRVDDDADDVPWAAWYEKRNLLRKIFDRKIWIQEPAVRWIQDQIALQAFALSLPAAAVFLVVFLTVPDGNMF